MFFPLRDINPIRHIRFAFVNYGLIGITALVFLYQSILPAQAFEFFAVSYGMIPLVVREVLPDPVSWLPNQLNFITYTFLHANWMHLLSNMLFLWIFGDNIEDSLGHFGYLFFYLACAALAAAAHFLFNFGDNGPLIGASGAVAGVMGAYVLLYPHAKLFVLAKIIIPIPLPIPAFWMLGLWVLTQFFYALGGSDEPVAWWAHIGGFAAGVGLMFLFRPRHIALLGGR